MRIIHDIDGEVQVSFGGSLYTTPKGKTGYPGYFKVQGVIVSKGMLNGDSDVIHIEGSSKYVREALKQAFEQVDIMDKMYREEDRKKKKLHGSGGSVSGARRLRSR